MTTIEVDFTWNPRQAFIESVATKVYYVVPAFVGGLMTGLLIWAVYIFLFKTGNCCFKARRNQPTPDIDPDNDPPLTSIRRSSLRL